MTTNQLKRNVPGLPQVFPDPRDHARHVCYKALILFSSADAFRRDEVVHIRLEHVARIQFQDGQVYCNITLSYSKAVQDDQSNDKLFIKSAAPGNESLCPVAALDVQRCLLREHPACTFIYLLPSSYRFGKPGPGAPLSAQTLVNALRTTARKAGLKNAKSIWGHSLRSGMLWLRSSAASPSGRCRRRQTGHCSTSSLRRTQARKRPAPRPPARHKSERAGGPRWIGCRKPVGTNMSSRRSGAFDRRGRKHQHLAQVHSLVEGG